MNSSTETKIIQIIVILGLPRSGTTLIGAIFDAHDDTCVCFEPWNRKKDSPPSPRLSPEELTAHYALNTNNSRTLVIKETSISPKALEWVQDFIEYNQTACEIKIVWTLRSYRHTYLSLIEKGKDWWGHENMEVNEGTYGRWVERASKSTIQLIKMYLKSPGIIYSYEALIENPKEVILGIMTASDLQYSEKLVNYHLHASQKNLRGDRNLQKKLSAISKDHISAREDQWEKHKKNIEKTPADRRRKELDEFASFLFQYRFITGKKDLEILIASARKNHLKPLLSVVVIVYSMPTQALNTIYSLSASHQKNVSENEYEIIVIENNSSNTLTEDSVVALGENITYICRDENRPSPVFAINEAVDIARSDNISIMIDGARLVTPGIVRATLDAFLLNSKSIVSVPGYHLGQEPQQKAVLYGYSEEEEKKLLTSVNWRENGYRLFDIACFSGSSEAHGILQRVPESNFLALPKELFRQLNGYDERFNSHGGGYANLDFFKRVVTASKGKQFLLLCEGTFHQYHGGATTGGDDGDRSELLKTITQQYVDIREEDYTAPAYDFELLGKFNSFASEFIIQSMAKIAKPDPSN